jgi:hypothetical protein
MATFLPLICLFIHISSGVSLVLVEGERECSLFSETLIDGWRCHEF